MELLLFLVQTVVILGGYFIRKWLIWRTRMQHRRRQGTSEHHQALLCNYLEVEDTPPGESRDVEEDLPVVHTNDLEDRDVEEE